MTEFNLRAAVDQVIDESGLTDPREIARKVAENVPAKNRVDVLAETLADYVRIRQGQRRAGNPLVGSRPAAPKSSKVASIREYWRRHLQASIHVGNAVHVPLGQCTYENLMYAAGERGDIARRNLAAQQRYETLAKLLRQHKVEYVNNLPQAVLAQVLADGAAA